VLDTLYMRIMITNSCKKADKVIVPSLNTKEDLVKILNIPSTKIVVIPEAARDDYKKISNKEMLEKIKQKYKLPRKFILFTGGVTPRKNLTRAIRAFVLAKKKLKDLYFVITGPKSWKNEKELALIEENEHIIKTGFIEDKDMPGLYNLALLYLYPSLYEGFGLPILEAQACGCPVICSHSSSLPEVGKDSVYYVNPLKEKDIAEGIIRVLSNKKLRAKLIRKGYQNAKRFSWKKAAKRILEEFYRQ
ncbi:glycosyltransferase family 4 protein, partial [bacterium]|nr:glycosyltransferase family 4 protein [bacterium]